jgi:hypothetical protein
VVVSPSIETSREVEEVPKMESCSPASLKTVSWIRKGGERRETTHRRMTESV